MIPVLHYAGVTLAVVGLGKSGLSAAGALRAGGASVLVWDDNPDARARAAEAGFTVVEPTDQGWRGVSKVIWSPGIPHTLPQPHPAADLARRMGLPLVCDVDILCEAKPDAGYIAITGTNGKSTTTALIAHVLQTGGHKAAAGGNLGVPALDMPDLPFTGTYVLELSSYQLELVPSLVCDVAVWLNVTPDHLSRHGGMDGYVAAKRHLFDAAARNAVAVIGVDDEASRAVCAEVRRRATHAVVPVSVREAVKGGIYVQDGKLIDASTGRAPREVCDLRDLPTLPGVHNWQNAACAYAAARARGVAAERIVAALKTFPGLPHRQQLVQVIDEVAFINDSKATNADATAKALACYDNILWIAGGQPKEDGIESLEPFFPRIRHAFLIGEAAVAFAKVLDGKVPYTLSGTLRNAVEEADEIADHGDVVLLSPACASFDQFRSFEHRGETFVAIVAELADEGDGGDEDEDGEEGPE